MSDCMNCVSCGAPACAEVERLRDKVANLEVALDAAGEVTVELSRLREENDWLRFFYQEADFGPADEDARWFIEERYRASGKALPAGYGGEP